MSIVKIDNVWQEGQRIGIDQSTFALSDGNSIYFSSDSSTDATIKKYNCDTGIWSNMLNLPDVVLLRANGSATATYQAYTPTVNSVFCYALKKINNIYYLAAHNSSSVTQTSAGIYASIDLEKWAPIVRYSSYNQYYGYYSVAGVLNGRVYVGKRTATMGGESFDEPKIANITTAFVAPNRYNFDANYSNTSYRYNDSFEGTQFFSTLTTGTMSSFTAIRDINEAKVGNYSYKLTATSTGTQECSWIGAYLYSCLKGIPANGSYIVISFWLKTDVDFPAGWYISPKIVLSAGMAEYNGSTGSIETLVYPSIYGGTYGTWRQIELITRVVDNSDLTHFQPKIAINSTSSGTGHIWIDGFTATATPTYIPQGMDYLPATIETTKLSVVDDISIVPLKHLGGNWTVSWMWWPLLGVENINGIDPIGHILRADDSYIDIYWKSTDKKFHITNGTTDVSSTETYNPWFQDCVKIAVCSDKDGISVFVNEPDNNSSITFTSTADSYKNTSPATTFKAGYNLNGTPAYGYGSFAYVRSANIKANQTAANILFNAITPLGTMANHWLGSGGWLYR
jgi:hypothetical protein